MNRIITAATPALALPKVLHALLTQGRDQPSRNGKTAELLHPTIHLDRTDNPYMTTPGRGASLVAQIAETMWMLAGRDDIEWLSRYLPRAADFSDDGKTWSGAYGPRLRGWAIGPERHGPRGSHDYGTVDQLDYVIETLSKDRDSRRAVFAIYDPVQDSGGLSVKDIPCNNWLHFLIRDGQLHTHVATRSNDAMWGWSGINSFAWSVLAQVVASAVGVACGPITFSISSLHLYERHFDKAQRIVDQTLLADNELDAGWEDDLADQEVAQITLPWAYGQWSAERFDSLLSTWFDLEGCIREYADGVRDHTALGMMQKIDLFPEPVMRSWLKVLLAWNLGSPLPHDAVPSNLDTPLRTALERTPPRRERADLLLPAENVQGVLESVSRLHADKGKVYGRSWCKRGEVFSILPNIARKLDRLDKDGAGDSAADTWVDLSVYLAKYKLWLENPLDPSKAEDPQQVEDLLRALAPESGLAPNAVRREAIVTELNSTFDDYLKKVEGRALSGGEKVGIIFNMLRGAWWMTLYVAAEEGWEYYG